MVRPEDKSGRLQFGKRLFDVDRAKPRAIAADDDNFVVAHLIGFLDGVLQSRGEVATSLPVDSRSIWD